MADKLSQDEIDKMLNGGSAESESDDATDDLKKLLAAADADDSVELESEDATESVKPEPTVKAVSIESEPSDTSEDFIESGDPDATEELHYLNETEADALGEIGNISLGSAATTLSMLLGQKVDITTPKVKEYPVVEELFKATKDCTTVEIKYKLGLDGTTIFALNPKDTAIIADLMMGGDGKVQDTEIGELQMSAVGEAMNQMIGTASTSMASMFNMPIDISPPVVKLQEAGKKLDLAEDIFGVPVIAVAFNLKVGDLIDSEFVQLMSLQSAQDQVKNLMNSMGNMVEEAASNQPAPQPQATPAPQPQASPQSTYTQPAPEPPRNPVTVQPVQFASFNDAQTQFGEFNKNLDLVMDVKLTLTVELGRTEVPIKKVLELTRGSVIELDKIAGEPVELYANGKLIAKGEVVVIEDNFGLRITSISSLDNRLKTI
ncbi:MAG: flagellar motor switch phosphatase FliY [Candidatus Gastranaerophilales bacterium]|nr:flagellar motor switch phosphatase FliY [Candidatus Gastranaerophilales bacterium]